MYKKITFCACIIVICLTSSAWSTVVYNEWTGGGGTSDWNTAANWNLGYVPDILAPNGTDNVKAGFKTATGPVLGPETTDAAAYQITLGGGSGGIVTMNGGSLHVEQYISMAVSSHENGTLAMNSGIITVGGSGSQKYFVGQAGTATVNMAGGNIDITGELTIADTAGSTGTVNLDGGIITAASLLMNRSGGATAELDISDGTLILNGDQTASIDGFVADANVLLVAYNGAGTVIRDYNVTDGKTTVTGYLPTPQATKPFPTNGAINVPIDANLSWTAGNDAVSHDVYFGTVSPGAFQGNQTATTFDPGTLAFGTIYYWRINEVNDANVVTTGTVWNFMTTTGQATNPSPANNATGVATDAILSWTASDYAVSHDVYFGTISPGTFQQNQTETTFDPCALTPSTTHYWRIDEVTESLGTITGTIWDFTTAPLKASDPDPADGAPDMPLNTTLSWTAGVGAVSHDVYFGTDPTPDATEFQGNQASTDFDPGILAATTTYYWRIDEKNGGTVTGDVWSFTTGTHPEVHPYLSWRNDPSNSIVVNWWNPIETGDSSVDYGLTSSYGSTAYVADVTHFHHVELTGLTPATTYHYRIRSSDGTVGSDNTFTTSGVNVTSFSFAVFGDVRGVGLPTDSTMYHTRHKTLCNWVASQDFDFAFTTGDTVWEGSILTTDNQTKREVESYFIEFFGAEQNLSKSKVIMATMGNHEVQPGGRDYTYYYDMYEDAFPTNGTADNKGRVYSFDYGNAHFVCLSSYQIDLGTQATWLAADLAAARANPDIKWIFAFMHAPMYTTSGHAGRTDEVAAWGSLFDQYHVDIVFAGHNHVYERSHSIKAGEVVDGNEGTVYVTSGMGGAPFNNGSEDPKFVCWYGAANLNKTLTACVTINGGQVTVQAIPNLTGEVLDSFVLRLPFLDGDFNESGTVDMNDLGMLTGSWLGTGMWP
jgi:hypothetical protein